jgi:peptide/nickel transport system permease protein
VLLATAVGVSSGYFAAARTIWWCSGVVDAWLSFPYLVIVLSVHGRARARTPERGAVARGHHRRRQLARHPGATIGVTQTTYVEAARAVGCGHGRIIVRHILPNVAATVIILATIGLGTAILAESALSFLGFGVPPRIRRGARCCRAPAGRTCSARHGWRSGQGSRISLAVFGFNMLGDALRDVLDPRCVAED